MRAKPGAHTVYYRDLDLVIEWYDFGSHAPYESANLLIFNQDAQAELAHALELGDIAPASLTEQVAARFDSYFEAKQFAEERGVPFEKEVDFMP